jgi:CxxC-x17-CxxC domain-containing protein
MKQFGKKDRFGKKNFGKRDFSQGGYRDRPERNGFSKSFDRPKSLETGFERRSLRGDEGSRQEIFQTTCGNCGKTATVPFKPTGSRPVLCKACFSEKKSSGPRADRFERRGRPHDHFEKRPQQSISSEMLEIVNRKLDKIMRALKIE